MPQVEMVSGGSDNTTYLASTNYSIMAIIIVNRHVSSLIFKLPRPILYIDGTIVLDPSSGSKGNDPSWGQIAGGVHWGWFMMVSRL